jgi:hypothetical protein
LRTLPPRSDRDFTARLYASPSGDATQAHDGRSSESAESTESSWTDTGDIAEQLADEEDPLRTRLGDDIHDELLAGVRRPLGKKRVRVQAPPGHSRTSPRRRSINKETIEVPDSATRRVTKAERLLATIMGSNSIHGLTGRPLM